MPSQGVHRTGDDTMQEPYVNLSQIVALETEWQRQKNANVISLQKLREAAKLSDFQVCYLLYKGGSTIRHNKTHHAKAKAEMKDAMMLLRRAQVDPEFAEKLGWATRVEMNKLLENS